MSTTKLNLLLFSAGINTEATQLLINEASKRGHSLSANDSTSVLFIPDPATKQSNSEHVIHGSIIALNTKQLQLIKASNANAASMAVDLIENVCKDQAKSQPIKPGATTTEPDNKKTSADGVDWSVINNLSHIKEAKSLFE